ncbi:class I SAM-dependent methyltransferase [Kiloniella laminariae]|uniref:Class I SAM-dependent methyltransferase n=1 Tax=Kiloniella laminariae TaxID=454162 RepID=A0ABT4LPN0_9PROT|nr:class I SAM-dependent methyltransferase [Kiloniella laminariae]MCZ4283100.1 class I SAM-dependent methyltransferase [Kiloniella laminariae]
MHKSLYSRPAKPRTMLVPLTRGAPEKVLLQIPEILAVDRATECHVTPDFIGEKMVDYLDAEANHSVLEPEAGTGNLVAALIAGGIEPCKITAIERHCGLFENLSQRFGKWPGVDLVNDCFLEYAGATQSEFDRIIMNPPFREARKHISCALRLLKPGGVLVALVPVTFTNDRAELLEDLPSDAFQNVKVYTKLIRFEN